MRNDKLLDSSVNRTFEEILQMTDEEFRDWVVELRKTVVDLWDNFGLPPRVGFTDAEMADQFQKMCTFYTPKFRVGEDIIRNTSVLGNAVNDFFPTMMKTRITYNSKDDAKSIYDFFADDALLERFMKYAARHFKRDSFFHYSKPLSVGDVIRGYKITDALSFAKWYFETKPDFGYYLCPVKEDKEYTGYNQKLKEKQNLVVSYSDIDTCYGGFGSFVGIESKTNVDRTRSLHYTIRVFEYGQKLFPIGLKAFRVSFCQYAVNFPPLTAKYLYERYTQQIPASQKLVKLYDPSAGWAGRLVGALAANPPGRYHYIGTDPNKDHTRGDRTVYHEVGEFFNRAARPSSALWDVIPKNTFEIYQLGSEVIHEDPNFQKHVGEIDLVFTSPPYFAKEVYSEDPEQSCHKFGEYEAWREGFLRPTLTTAARVLRRNRYLLWNIADALFAGTLLPLELDSRSILEELGLVYVETLKMTLAQMPGGNRFEETDEFVEWEDVWLEKQREVVVKGKMKNSVQIVSGYKKIWLKYEPIMVFHKP